MIKINIENIGIILNEEDEAGFHSSLLLNGEVVTQLNTKNAIKAEHFFMNFILDHSLRRLKLPFSSQQQPTQSSK